MCASVQTRQATPDNLYAIEPERVAWHWMINTGVFKMNMVQKLAVNAATVTLLLGLGGCAGMSAQDKNTAIGAGVGAVGGAVLTGGSAIGTVGGAAVGGVIGHEIKKK